MAVPLTPSEVALAQVLAAWVVWFVARNDDGVEHDAMNDIGDTLHKRGLIDGEPTKKGRALLDRARKAGVL